MAETVSHERPKLSDALLDEIERQIDDDTPVYVWTLIRELRESRKLLRVLTEAVTR